jgi:hypothetical protein
MRLRDRKRKKLKNDELVESANIEIVLAVCVCISGNYAQKYITELCVIIHS